MPAESSTLSFHNKIISSHKLFHNFFNDLKAHKARQKPSELHRVETWITSPASTRSAGLKGRSSVTRSSATTLATVYANTESQVSKGSICRHGDLEEKDEERGFPSQDRGILGKRARKTVEVPGQTLVCYIFILMYFSFSQELKSPLAFPLLPRSPALRVASAG